MYTFLIILALALFVAFTEAGGMIAAFFIQLIVGIFDRQGGERTAGRFLRRQAAWREELLRFLRRR